MLVKFLSDIDRFDAPMGPADVTSGKLFDGVWPATFDELEPGFSTPGNNI